MPRKSASRRIGAVVFLVFAISGVATAEERPMEKIMREVGRTFRFDYGDLVIKVEYLSDRRLRWEQVKGPEAGRKGEEQYAFDAIRPGVYFIWWQEKDTSAVSQVADFERGRVHTTWISPDRELAAFDGTITPAVAAPPTASSDDVASELVAIEKRFAEAVVKPDVEAIQKIVSDDWAIIGPEGRLIDGTTFMNVIRSGALTHTKMESDETRVRVYGDSAVVTTRVVSSGAYQGQAFTTRERSTDVFVRDRGGWRCILTQLTAISEP
jgi:ketosteroid isomerase-like protein